MQGGAEAGHHAFIVTAQGEDPYMRRNALLVKGLGDCRHDAQLVRFEFESVCVANKHPLLLIQSEALD